MNDIKENYEQQYIDLCGGGTFVAIPNSVKGQIHLTHPNGQFKLLLDKEELYRFLESAKPFSECSFSEDYIILQMMQHEETGGTLVEFLRLGNLSGRFTDPTVFDLAPWISVERDLPMDGQRVLAFVGEKEEDEFIYTNVTMKIYSAQNGFQFNNPDIKVLFWKPLSPPEGFNFL